MMSGWLRIIQKLGRNVILVGNIGLEIREGLLESLSRQMD